MRAALAAGVAFLALPAASPSTGVLTGTVTRGPTTPVCRAGKPCTEPARQLVLVFRRAGAVERTRTDGAGSYRIRLTAGSWSVSLTRIGVGTRIDPADVRVVGGQTREVDFSIDTGIR
jgi:hypothetical protein